MGKADGLSKRPDWKVEVEKDNNNQVFIKDCWLHNLSVVLKKEKVYILKDEKLRVEII